MIQRKNVAVEALNTRCQVPRDTMAHRIQQIEAELPAATDHHMSPQAWTDDQERDQQRGQAEQNPHRAVAEEVPPREPRLLVVRPRLNTRATGVTPLRAVGHDSTALGQKSGIGPPLLHQASATS